MELFYETPDGRAKLYLGDSRHLSVEDESIDMIATSPPYWGKRDYGEDVVTVWGGEDGCEHIWESDGGRLRVDSPWGEGGEGRLKKYDKNVEAKGERAYCSLCGAWRGQLGLEPTWQEYITHLCECAEEWWRVLKPTGNLFVNISDTYVGKDLAFIPERFALALKDAGWTVRNKNVWYKGKEYPNGKITKVAMPESVKDRMSCSYEMLFHIVKEPKGYWFDLDAVRRPHLPESYERAKYGWNVYPEAWDGKECPISGGKGGWHLSPGGANPGDVWIIQPEPFKWKHYSVWPSKLCEMMIKVGCPKEVCPKCGKPRGRLKKTLAIEDHPLREDRNVRNVQFDGQGYSESEGTLGKVRIEETIGWSDCGCGEGFVPGVVVDPFFGGSYRIAKEALKLGRNVIGIDMKEEYLEMAKDIAIYGEKGLSKEKARRKQGVTQGVLL